ncbi:MAG TPA: RNA-binding protein [Clostridiaceae bacterium]|nr:RNA-binding protein [Clostridiaceae bacterium]
MKFTPGELVISKAGRDAGRVFVVVKNVDENYVLISDGDLRKIEKPKKKKIKHIESCGIIIDSIKERLENNIRVTNADIRKQIKAYTLNDKEV